MQLEAVLHPLAVTFDLDGTLAEIGPRKARMLGSVLRHGRIITQYSATLETFRGQRPSDLDDAVARALGKALHREPADVRDILQREIDGRWPKAFRGARPPAAVAAVIKDCDSLGLPRAVVSDHPALDKLAAMELGGWSAVIDARALGALKPLPDALHAAAAQLGVPINRLLHVGDRDDTDGAMAAAAGCAFISVAELRAGRPALRAS